MECFSLLLGRAWYSRSGWACCFIEACSASRLKRVTAEAKPRIPSFGQKRRRRCKKSVTDGVGPRHEGASATAPCACGPRAWLSHLAPSCRLPRPPPGAPAAVQCPCRDSCAHTSGPPPRHSIKSDVSTSMSSRPTRRKNSATSRGPYARPRISPSARSRLPPLGDGRPTTIGRRPDMPPASARAHPHPQAHAPARDVTAGGSPSPPHAASSPPASRRRSRSPPQ